MWRIRIRASAVVLDTNQRVLLIQQAEDLWMLPGGGIEPGETILDGLRREFKEETGLEIEPTRLLWLDEEIADNTHHISVIFLAEVTGGSIDKGKHDCHYYSRHEIARINVSPRWLKDELWDAVSVNYVHDPARLGI